VKSESTPDLVSPILASLRADGFATIGSFASERLLPLCRLIGVPRGDVRDPRIVRALQPQPVGAARSNTLSSRYGTGPFPFHTEGAYWLTPPKFVVLYCVNPGGGARPTLLADSDSWQLDDSARGLLENAGWKVTARRPFLSSVFDRRGDRVRVRFDQECMVPFTADADSARTLLMQQLEQREGIEIRWSAYDLLVIDNERMLHGRGDTLIPDPDRILHRVLLSEVP
jgi:L-asparagine oxygenase